MNNKSNELLSKTAYLEIRAAMRDGRIQPGERMRERELSGDLDLGRTPVREALKRLEFEGFLVQTSENGLIYQKLTPADIIEIHAVLALLLGLAHSEAARNATDIEISTMRELLQCLKESIDGELRDVLTIARGLDQLIFASARNRFLTAQLQLIGDRVGLQSTGRSTLTRSERRHEFLADTEKIVEAIAARDCKHAEKYARARAEHGLRSRLAMDAAAEADHIVTY